MSLFFKLQCNGTEHESGASDKKEVMDSLFKLWQQMHIQMSAMEKILREQVK